MEQTIKRILYHLICLKCGFGSDPDRPWNAKSETPGCCPACHSPTWDEPVRTKYNRHGMK